MKHLSALLTGLFVVLLAVAVLGSQRLLLEAHWPIKWIEVQGDFERVSAEQVRATAVPMMAAGFFGVDLPRVRSTVEALPWVRSAEVRKRWPDQIRIRILEHVPTARWGKDQLVSGLGEVFSVESGLRIEGLPVLQGPADAAPEMIGFYRQLQDRLLGTGLDVQALELSQRGAWRAVLNDGLKIELGRDQPLRRFSRWVGALDDLILDPGRQLARIDLRYTNGFAVAWRKVEQPAVLAAIDEGRFGGSTQ